MDLGEVRPSDAISEATNVEHAIPVLLLERRWHGELKDCMRP